MNRVKRNKKNMVQSFILHVKDSLLWSQQGTKCHDIAAAVYQSIRVSLLQITKRYI